MLHALALLLVWHAEGGAIVDTHAALSLAPTVHGARDLEVDEGSRISLAGLEFIDRAGGSANFRASIAAEHGDIHVNYPAATPEPVPAAYMSVPPSCNNLTLYLGGTCSNLTNGLRLTLAAGLTFNGFTFDDDKAASGNNQPINVCLLSLYGDRGIYTQLPTNTSFAIANGPAKKTFLRRLWYASCVH